MKGFGGEEIKTKMNDYNFLFYFILFYFLEKVNINLTWLVNNFFFNPKFFIFGKQKKIYSILT